MGGREPVQAWASGPSVAGSDLAPAATRGLARDRLDALLDGIWSRGFALVRGPAGSGKTTAMTHFAARVDIPVAWCTADASDAEERIFVASLEASLSRVIPDITRGWRTATDVIAALDGRPGRYLLVLDDLHAIDGSPAERVVARLVGSAPASLFIMAASRTTPAINVPRLRVNELLVEIGPDALRFRSWEVERLFHQIYREPLPPEDLATLARRTGGWAAGLQLFHLATEGRPMSERRYVLDSLAGRSKLVQEYLATNVLDTLPADIRSFLIHSSVLGKLSGSLCDALLERSGSGLILDELRRRQMFTDVADEAGSFRYHEVLRSYLVAALVEEVGEDEVRARFTRAATLLERSGETREALQAYCRAGDLAAVARLLGRRGDELTDGADELLETVPSSIVRHDPWLLLARARRSRAAGRWAEAVDGYRRAEESSPSWAAAERARNERLAISAFLDATPAPMTGWVGVLRAAALRSPLRARRTGSPDDAPTDGLARALCALVAGHLDEARSDLIAVATHAEASQAAVTGARVGLGLIDVLGDPRGDSVSIEAAADEADRCGLPWLSRLARAAAVASGRPDWSSEAAANRHAFERNDDVWGSALSALFEGWGSLRSGSPRPERLESASYVFQSMGAGVLEAWARGLHALCEARLESPTAVTSAAAALRLARRLEVPGAELLALHAVILTGAHADMDLRDDIVALEAECGLAVPEPIATDDDRVFIEVRCLGGLKITVGGQPLDLSGLKPRARTVLRFLLMHEGRPVHREALLTALWPELDAERRARSLHVALSGLRRVLGAIVPEGPDPLVREGEAYALALPAGVSIDTAEIERASIDAHEARAAGQTERSIAASRRVLELYSGELFPEDGPAEWVLAERDRLRSMAVDAAVTAAELLASIGDLDGCADACTVGIRIDRYRDELWRLRIDALQRAGRQAAARRVEAEYGKVLRELGVGPESEDVGSAPPR